MGKIQCLKCGEILESKYRHDFQMCVCDNETFIDGGYEYARVGGKNLNKIKFIAENDTYLPEQS